MKKTEIACIGCGKMLPVTCGEGHTGIVKCDCVGKWTGKDAGHTSECATNQG